MQDQGPFHDEPPPTDDELRAARALADELDGASPPTRGSLAETALIARAASREEPPLDRAIVRRGIEEGSVRRRRSTRVIAFTTFAAAAVALAGLVVTRAVWPAAPQAPPITTPPPSLTVLAPAPFPEGQRTSERVDLMAHLAAGDWIAAQVTAAHAGGAR